MSNEKLKSTENEKIFVEERPAIPEKELRAALEELQAAIDAGNRAGGAAAPDARARPHVPRARGGQPRGAASRGRRPRYDRPALPHPARRGRRLRRRGGAAMARLAVESGVTDIAATPHCNAPDPFYNYADSALHARFARLRQRLEREQIPCAFTRGWRCSRRRETTAMRRPCSAGRGICSSSSPSARANGSSTRCSPPCARGG